jgi:predicted ATPase
VATQIENLGVGASYGDRSLHEQSHGESFLALMVNRFRGEGLYLLDEPEAALSPSRQLSVITRIHDLVQQKSQFVIATHSPIIMAYPNAYIYSFSEKGIERIAYKETEHFRITHDFLSNPQRMLRFLMEP